MDSAAVAKAQTRLAKMNEAFGRMKTGKEFSQFVGEWTDFLVAGQEIYNYLSKGSRDLPRSRQWFAQKKNERSTDALLIYLHQARNADEHGIEPIAEHRPGHIGVGASGGTIVIHRMLINAGHVAADFTPVGGGTLNLEMVEAHAALIPVWSRGNWYHPPRHHLGTMLKAPSPVDVAELGLAYHARLVEEAQQLII